VKYDVVIIGGGHNGLVAACYLAKGGLKTLVLERREVVGGGAELDQATGPFSAQVVADLGLKLAVVTPKVRVLALSDDDRSLCIYNNDVGATVMALQLTRETAGAGAQIDNDVRRELEEIQALQHFVGDASLQNGGRLVTCAGPIEGIAHASMIEA